MSTNEQLVLRAEQAAQQTAQNKAEIEAMVTKLEEVQAPAIAEAKEAIRQAINDKGVVVNTDDPFSTYAEKIQQINQGGSGGDGEYIGLSEEDVRSGVSFTDGTTNKIGTFTSDATAVSEDILEGKTAYVNGDKIIGSIAKADTEWSAGVLNISKGYFEKSIGIRVRDLTPDNIKTGVSIVGVEGTFTSDATADAEDIAAGKIAYVKGKKLIGTATASGGSVVKHWRREHQNHYYLNSYIYDAQTSAVPVNGINHNFLCVDGKILYRPQNRIADTSIKWKYAVSDSRDYFAIAISDDGKLYNVDYYVTNADGELKATRLCPDVEGFTQTTGRVLGDKTLAIANGDLYLTHAANPAYYARVQYKREKETDPVVYVEAANLLNCQQSSYDYAYVITYDGDLARVWCTGDSGVGDAYAEIYSSDRANGNPFLNYYPVSSDYEDYNSRTYEFAFREDGLWYRQPGTALIDGAWQPRPWSKAEDPGLIKTDFIGYCSSYAEENYEYNEETGEENWVYKFKETQVALHIDTQGRLWKLAVAGTVDGSTVNFTGLSVTQVGEDSDWTCVPPSINSGSNKNIAQKGGKLINMTATQNSEGKIELAWWEFPFSPSGQLIANTNNYDLFFAPDGVTVDMSKPGGTY